jgi:predicted PurR-regulated permease PerM
MTRPGAEENPADRQPGDPAAAPRPLPGAATVAAGPVAAQLTPAGPEAGVAGPGPGPPPETARQPVPVRTILAAIGLVLATVLLLLLIRATHRVLVWIVIAGFFAVAVYPVVNWIERRLPWCRRSLATLAVYLLLVLLIAGLITLFAVPLAREGTSLAHQLPTLIDDARAGRGPVGRLLDRTHVLSYIQQNDSKIRSFVSGLGAPALGFLKTAATGVAATITIFVVSFLMVVQGPRLVRGTLALFPGDRAEHIRAVGTDCAKTVTGYISGNLVISVICGALTYAVLTIIGIPFSGLIALFVGIADLIPLVGATLGAVVAGLAAFIYSVPAGIIVVIFFVVYQQLENHLLQPLIFSRTVKLDPLTVLIAILVAVELAGLLGALLAIPIAGMIQIILRDLWAHHRGRFNPKRAVGESPAHVSQAPNAGPAPPPP